MTTTTTVNGFEREWLERVSLHADKLRQLIGAYHPSAMRPVKRSMEITAPAAEAACEVVRNKIANEQPADPVTRFDKALAESNVGEIMSLLNGAWFGVPESTSCWRIPGFSEAVDLLDDPPDPPQQVD